MANINDLYNLARYIVRKERNVYLLIDDFNLNLDRGQMDLFEEYFSLYGKDQTVHDALRVFRVTWPFTSGSDGSVSFQANHMHILGSPYIIYGSTIYPVRFIQEDELPLTLTNQLRPVGVTNPIAIDSSAGFVIYPNQVFSGSYFYLKRPNTPDLVFTQVGRVITYDAIASTQLQWLEPYWNNIMVKALKYSTVNMDEKGIEEYATQYDNETKAK